ncbi:GNAT family acetyltransferase [Streptomyces qinglanensis]|uniref:GNAT family acetyltransferase n=1 Tax=Streptomyces qinglanensis TaxID=943816 RepID=A0A1E7K5B2_9ACTN|nr:GNAT family N-acetyltransferase [Streptomyces qinglanensis]OEU99122.1 GNAT family acetyltransferase [Streptomyces qinglanensis]
MAEPVRSTAERARHEAAVRIRPIVEGDWDAIAELERDAYGSIGLSEGRAALQARANASPATCFTLDLGPRTVGYVLALPYPAFHYPVLERTGEAAHTVLQTAGNLHLHDIVVAGPLRRRGLAQHLLRHLGRIAGARGDERISLVSVGGSEGFWSARGFVPHPRIVPAGSGYGVGAVYMSKPVRAPGPSSGPRSAPRRDPAMHHEVN